MTVDKEKFFREIMQVDDSSLVRELSEISDILYQEKGELFIHQGDKQEDFLFLVSGVFRGFYLDMNGKEITDCFGVIPGTPAMSASISNTASPISIEAATECGLVRLPGRELLPLIESNALQLKIYNEILQAAIQIHCELKLIFSQRTALEPNQYIL